ncbi:MAG: hypothetical protein LAP87_10430 [Acidobacteriia bacterium]|nr:hypothetical protein [Terriglobia bacterium]
MSAPSTPAGFGIWQAEGFSAIVEYSFDVVEEIRRQAVEGLNSLGHGGLETGGVLYGVRKGDTLRVLAGVEAPCEHALGPGFVLSEKDRLGLAKLAAAPPAGMETVGWYCSHTRSRIVLTPNDCAIFEHFFPRPRQVALVVKPAPLGPAEGAFLFLEAFAPHREFSIQPLAVRAVSPPADAHSEGGGADDRPRREGRAKPRMAAPAQRVWLWAAPALTAVALLVASQLTSTRLGLEARAVAPGQVRIGWNRNSSAILAASSGLLEIKDGDSRVLLPLSADQLRSGAITYARHSATVGLRLHINQRKRGAPALEEAIRFGPPPAAPAAPAPKASPASPVAGGPAGSSEADRQAPEQPSAAAPERIPVAAPALPPLARRQVRLAMPAASAALPPVLPAAPEFLLSANSVAAPPLPIAAPGPAPRLPVVDASPRSGRLIWTGTLGRRGVVEIDGPHASNGSVNGSLPGVPVFLHVSPAEFAAGGLLVFTGDAARNGRTEPASQSNGWNKTRFAWDPERVRQIAILEAPNPSNGFRRLVLRNDSRRCAMILIEWRLP